MNDYTCPKCKGKGSYTQEFDSGLDAPIFTFTCDACVGKGRLPDRRKETVSDRRALNIFLKDRRRNEAFSDRRKKI